MYLYLSLAERKVAGFYQNMDGEHFYVWLNKFISIYLVVIAGPAIVSSNADILVDDIFVKKKIISFWK